MKVRVAVKPMCNKCQRVFRKRTMFIICPANPRHRQRQKSSGDVGKKYGKISPFARRPVKRGVPLRRMHTSAHSHACGIEPAAGSCQCTAATARVQPAAALSAAASPSHLAGILTRVPFQAAPAARVTAVTSTVAATVTLVAPGRHPLTPRLAPSLRAKALAIF